MGSVAETVELFSPHASSLSPHEYSVESHTVPWAIGHKLIAGTAKDIEKLKMWQLARFAARTYPGASEEQLKLACDFNAFLFVCDDVADGMEDKIEQAARKRENGMTDVTKRALKEEYERRVKALDARLMAVCKGAEPGCKDHPVVHALHDILVRAKTVGHVTWVRQFVTDLQHTSAGVRWERLIRHSRKGRQTSLATYTKLRTLSVGAYMQLDLVGLFLEGESAENILGNSYVQQMRLMATNHIAWVNDIYSVERDVTERSGNVVLVLCEELGVEMKRGVELARGMCNKEMMAFMELERQLVILMADANEGARKGVVEYVKRLGVWMKGNLDWSCETSRYRE